MRLDAKCKIHVYEIHDDIYMNLAPSIIRKSLSDSSLLLLYNAVHTLCIKMCGGHKMLVDVDIPTIIHQLLYKDMTYEISIYNNNTKSKFKTYLYKIWEYVYANAWNRRMHAIVWDD